MPCLMLVVMLAFPRVILVAMYFLTTLLSRAYGSNLLVLLLGFLFLPITTIAYALMVNQHIALSGANLLILLVTVLLDLGSGGSGLRRRS